MIIALILATTACVSTSSVDTGASDTTQDTAPSGTTATTVSIPEDGAPTDEAVAADQEFRVVPDGFADCDSVVLTSGWPTTSVYVESRNDCILEAAASGTPAQYSYTGRDLAGGMAGTILRVLGPGEILMIDYAVSPSGTVTDEETTCAELTTQELLPACA